VQVLDASLSLFCFFILPHLYISAFFKKHLRKFMDGKLIRQSVKLFDNGYKALVFISRYKPFSHSKLKCVKERNVLPGSKG